LGFVPPLARIAALIIAAAFIALAAVAVRRGREQPPPPPPPLRLSFALPDGVEAGVADETLDAALSPDGSQVVFVGTERGGDAPDGARPGVARLWRRLLAEERASALAGTDGARQPAWKTTGNAIAFFADGRLKQVTLQDGVVHDLAAAPAAFGATWLADGSLLFATGMGPIQRLAEGRTTNVTTLAGGESAHVFPVATGRRSEFVYVAVRDDGRRTVRLASSQQTRDLTTTSGHAAMVAGRLLHVRDGVLLAYSFDEETGALSPRGTPVALDVGVAANGRALFAAAPRLLLHAARGNAATEVRWLDFSGQRGAAIADAGDYSQVRVSPDDRQAAIAVLDPLLRGLDVAVVPADGSLYLQRLTVALAAETDPVWAPDARRVLFRSTEGGSPNLFARRVPPREQQNEVILRSDLDETPTDWRAERILFQARRNRQFDLMTLDVPTGRIEAVVESAFAETDARWSPDGRWLAFVSDESGRPDVYVRRPDAIRIRVSFGGGRRPRWTRDGRALLFVRGSQVMRADLTAGQPAGTMFAPPQPLFEAAGIRDFDVAHQSDRILALLPVAGETPPVIGAVLNWSSLAQN
jgi:Tol biopolymer transport system component